VRFWRSLVVPTHQNSAPQPPGAASRTFTA